MLYQNYPYRVKNEMNQEAMPLPTHIPLPNNPEKVSEEVRSPKFSLPSAFNFIKDRLTLEEIILIGILIILLWEGVADEFLLLMLVYILIF